VVRINENRVEGPIMDGRAQLQALAGEIGGASAVEAAWAGAGPARDIRKQCGICGLDQPARIPFLRHVCRGCSAIWVPGICVDCATTSVTFTLDGQLSRFATCGCRGRLRQVAYVPRPREAQDPQQVAAHAAVVTRRKRRLTTSTRVVLVLTAVLSVVGCVRFLQADHSPAPAGPPTTVQRPVADSTSLTPEERGHLAGQRLLEQGQSHDGFSCAAQLPSGTSADGAVQGFLAGCLAG
jgi:hypothetical protein